MIRECTHEDFEAILAIINNGAEAYRGVIPFDRWHEPYMAAGELRHEIGAGVRFSGVKTGESLIAVMGIQAVQDVMLVRHAYVRTDCQRRGEGGRLLDHLMLKAHRPVMVGTWKAARWAVSFYEKHGFTLIEGSEKDRLLRTYWDIPERQMETSIVMADQRALGEVVQGHDAPAASRKRNDTDPFKL